MTSLIFFQLSERVVTVGPIARVAAVMSDALVLLFTWKRTHGIRQDAGTHQKKMKLSFVLIRNGTLVKVDL